MARAQKAPRTDLQASTLDRLIAEMEAGAAPWLKPWNNASGPSPIMAGLPRNGSSGRRYSGINVLTLMLAAEAAGYTEDRWYTFKQLSAIGGNVKGQKGTAVIWWKPTEFKRRNAEGEVELHKTVIMKTFSVFNHDQITWQDGEEPRRTRTVIKTAPWETCEALQQQVKRLQGEAGLSLSYGGNVAAYMPTIDQVVMPQVAQFKSASHHDATLAHELVHWTGHTSRLDRNLRNTFGSGDYAFEELVAELGAAFIAAELGFANSELRHAGYLQSWARKLREQPKALSKAAALASKAVDMLVPQE